MKGLRTMIFDDSSLSEEEEYDDDFEMAIAVILNAGFRRPILGSQFVHLYFHRDRAYERLLQPKSNLSSISAVNFGCTLVSSSPLQKPWRSMMIGLN